MSTSFAEQQLMRIHDAATTKEWKWRDIALTLVFGISLITALPYIHIGIFYMIFWTPGKGKVDRAKCSCSCFDTVFRGSYEYPPSSYKHVYFNATGSTLKICLLTVACVLAAYETIRHLYTIARYSSIRPTMLLLVLVSIYPNYYTWWSYFSYLNEEFYDHWYHDIFFSVTEWISTIVALHLCDIKNEFTTWKLLIMISINCVHIFVAGLDQFAVHVILKKGLGFQNARNFGLMIPDWLFVIVAIFEMFRMMRAKNLKITELFYKEEIAASVIFILIATVLMNNV